jgi:hypothetical protein
MTKIHEQCVGWKGSCGVILSLCAPLKLSIRCLALGMATLLAGCSTFDPSEIKDCEASIQSRLKAPSTYKRISATRTFMSEEKPPEVWVSIAYDAVNTFNAPLRDSTICEYPAFVSGSVDWTKYQAAQARGELAIDAIDAAAAEAVRKEAAAAKAAAKAKPKYPYVAPDGVDILNAEDERNWKKYGTTDPDGGE